MRIDDAREVLLGAYATEHSLRAQGTLSLLRQDGLVRLHCCRTSGLRIRYIDEF